MEHKEDLKTPFFTKTDARLTPNKRSPDLSKKDSSRYIPNDSDFQRESPFYNENSRNHLQSDDSAEQKNINSDRSNLHSIAESENSTMEKLDTERIVTDRKKKLKARTLIKYIPRFY